MFDFRGLDMLTLQIEPFKSMKKKSFYEKSPEKFLSLGQRHPVMGKIFKMFEFFGFDLITFRIGPFGVDD